MVTLFLSSSAEFLGKFYYKIVMITFCLNLIKRKNDDSHSPQMTVMIRMIYQSLRDGYDLTIPL